MGLQQSRITKFPTIVFNKEYREKTIENWKEQYSNPLNNEQDNPTKSTLGEKNLTKAGEQILNFFNEKYPDLQLKILDIMCGNGTSSKYVYQVIQSKVSQWIMTDLFDWKKQDLPEVFQFEHLHSVASIEKFGKDSNALLLISPPPCSVNETDTYSNGLGDLYACQDFIEQTINEENREPKFIIFIGELGASDGTEGMYRFLLENEHLSLEHRNMILISKDVIGGNCEKELFIFQIV